MVVVEEHAPPSPPVLVSDACKDCPDRSRSSFCQIIGMPWLGKPMLALKSYKLRSEV